MYHPTKSFADCPYIEMADGNKIPQYGLGTYQYPDELLEDFIKLSVLKYGVRHIDTALFYRNEPIIGKALKYCFE